MMRPSRDSRTQKLVDPGQRSPDSVLKDVTAQYELLSGQLKKIARYIEQTSGSLGLQGVQDVASACGVQPSAVVRFAKQFGFSGFSEMQRVFRDAMVQQIAPEKSYQSRIRRVIESGSKRKPSELATEFLKDSMEGMQYLSSTLDGSSFDRAVEILAQTDSIWLVGVRRSFPVVTYLDYALQHTGKRVQLVSGLGGMQSGQLRSLRKGDVMVAVSFAPYAEETQSVAIDALERGARMIAITDSRFNIFANSAEVTLLLKESETFGFRSLTSTMGLVQGMFIALAYSLELAYEPAIGKSKI
jgi:DNA-binding MurR/RpiR family transcriptional regulator